MEPIKLTAFAHGAGCGCKIAPAVLEQILAQNNTSLPGTENLLVDNSTRDDAAVYDLGQEQALIVTADFFMPIVDDPYIFGQAAAANAISDVYAMGGKPITAIALLGWPIEKLPAAVAAQVLDGARAICKQAGIVISGGHTIESPEPFFGLSVNGIAATQNIKRNSTARSGDLLFISKPIGTGILATAGKRGQLQDAHRDALHHQLISLNKLGEALGKEAGVTALTDVTGFGLLGHLLEMCEGAGLAATLQYASIPIMEGAREYARQGIVPDATYRNWNAYGNKVTIAPKVDAMESFILLPDPQTNGGLLVAVDPSSAETVKALAAKHGALLQHIGHFGTGSGVSVE